MQQRITLADGGELSVLVQGAGHPVLFVHGFPLDHTMWRAQMGALADQFQVIAPDLRGFGQSSVTAGTVTMQQHADDLAELLATLGINESVTLCGLSMGGYIAWQFWKRHPERLARLILCDTRAAADSAEAQQTRHTVASRVLAEGSDFLAEAMPAKLFSPYTFTHHPELITATQRIIRTTQPQGIAAAALGMAARVDATDWLGDIDVPTLLIVGQDDQITTVDEMRSLAALIPEASFVAIDDAGHMAPLEAPQPVNAAIEHFLLGTSV
ncbi:MAG: alpha/beta fold hydrolase [Planctomycetaceae bacterium]|nr:alpha/beta fold hydrolase [Planctomycetaceae bacterium]